MIIKQARVVPMFLDRMKEKEKRIEREINILFRKRKEGIRLEFHSRISF